MSREHLTSEEYRIERIADSLERIADALEEWNRKADEAHADPNRLGLDKIMAAASAVSTDLEASDGRPYGPSTTLKHAEALADALRSVRHG